MTDSESQHFIMPLNLGTIESVPQYQMDESTIAEILNIVDKSQSDKDGKAFIDAICHSISSILTLKSLQAQGCSHSEKRKQLIQLKKACQLLMDGFCNLNLSALRDLDLALQKFDPPHKHSDNEIWNPENKPFFIISSSNPLSSFNDYRIEQLTNELKLISKSVDFLENEIYSKTKTGRPKENYRIFLARDLAIAFKDILKITPTTTQETEFTKAGPYISILSIVLAAAGLEMKDPHKLACQAIKQI